MTKCCMKTSPTSQACDRTADAKRRGAVTLTGHGQSSRIPRVRCARPARDAAKKQDRLADGLKGAEHGAAWVGRPLRDQAPAVLPAAIAPHDASHNHP